MVFLVVTEDNELIQCFMNEHDAGKFADQMTRPGRVMRVVRWQSPYTEHKLTIA